MALGAAYGGIAILVARQVITRALLGMRVGSGLGAATASHIQSLLYGVQATNVLI